MTKITPEWLRQQLSDDPDAKKALAAHLGIEPNKVYKMLSGARRPQGDEVVRILEFLRARNGHGFAEGRQPTMDMSALLGDPPKNEATDAAGAIKMAIVGDTVQVAATVKADDLDELIRRLKLARQMLGD